MPAIGLSRTMDISKNLKQIEGYQRAHKRCLNTNWKVQKTEKTGIDHHIHMQQKMLNYKMIPT